MKLVNDPQFPLLQNRGKKGHVETFVVNPKCVKLGELYGETDPHTFEWSDGLIAAATRRFAKESASPVPSLSEDTKSLRPISTMTDVSSVTHMTYVSELFVGLLYLCRLLRDGFVLYFYL